MRAGLAERKPLSIDKMKEDVMGCGSCGPKKTEKYVCVKCGKEEMREAKEGEEVKSCCGQPMKKK